MDYQYCKENVDEVLPIKSIDGVNVCVSIEKCHKGEIMLRITGYNESGHAWLSLKEEDFEKSMDTLQHMKFNNFHCRFYDERTPHISLFNDKLKDISFYEKFSSFKHIKMQFDECCICYELTKGITTCNHSICGRCLSNMKINVCPLCRKDLDEEDDE